MKLDPLIRVVARTNSNRKKLKVKQLKTDTHIKITKYNKAVRMKLKNKI